MIDDYTVCSVNDTTTVHSKVDLHMVDTFCGAVKEFFTNCPAVMMQHGLEAKTYDLKSAYRQVPVRSDHLKHSYFCVYDHKAGGPKIFRLKTLPFGAVHSVYSFLRLAKAIHAIASRALHLFTTNFYDDFIVASPPCLKESASHSMEMIFTLLGWDYAKEGRKATVFDKMCNALGVTFNLEKSHVGVMIVSNTSKRRSELLGDLGLILDRGSLLKAEALRLRGRLQFADSCLHGRIGSIALKRLAEHAYTPNASITDELRQGLVFLKQRLETNHSRTINKDPEMTWFVFSDASYEPEGQSGGIGAVLCNECGAVVSWFKFLCHPDFCKALGADTKSTIIYELEMLALIFAALVWQSNLSCSLSVFFCDNESVRFALIRAAASGAIAERMLFNFLQIEADVGFNPWFGRIASEANIADFPSRDVPHPLLIDSLQVENASIESRLKDLAQNILFA